MRFMEWVQGEFYYFRINNPFLKKLLLEHKNDIEALEMFNFDYADDGVFDTCLFTDGAKYSGTDADQMCNPFSARGDSVSEWLKQICGILATNGVIDGEVWRARVSDFSPEEYYLSGFTIGADEGVLSDGFDTLAALIDANANLINASQISTTYAELYITGDEYEQCSLEISRSAISNNSDRNFYQRNEIKNYTGISNLCDFILENDAFESAEIEEVLKKLFDGALEQYGESIEHSIWGYIPT